MNDPRSGISGLRELCLRQFAGNYFAANPPRPIEWRNPGKLEVRNGNGHLSLTETYRYTYLADGFAATKTTTSVFGGNTETYATSYFFLEP